MRVRPMEGPPGSSVLNHVRGAVSPVESPARDAGRAEHSPAVRECPPEPSGLPEPVAPPRDRPAARWAGALLETALGRLVLTLAVAAAGWLGTRILDVADLARSPAYAYLAAGLLAVGLYSSTHGIDVREARQSLRVVLLAVTVGVVAKAILISAVMYVVFRRPEYLVLGVAVAQIDPLSVAAMQARSRMSPRAKAILLAWASFDDPITTLLTLYLSGLTLSVIGGRSSGQAISDGSLLSFGTGLALSLGFAVAALLIWILLKRGRGRPSADHTPVPAGPPEDAAGGWSLGRGRTAVAALAVLVAVAVWQFLMLGLALAGLFFRPPLGKWVGRLTNVAFLLAVFVLGLLLGPGIDFVRGAVLGVAAFAAQAVVGVLVAGRQNRQDRIFLALGQQNGITAIILALLLEPDFPGTVAIVAPAILVINVLNLVSNSMWDNWGGLTALVTMPPRRTRPRWRGPRIATGTRLVPIPVHQVQQPRRRSRQHVRRRG